MQLVDGLACAAIAAVECVEVVEFPPLYGACFVTLYVLCIGGILE